MFIAYLVIAIVLALGLFFSARAKLTRDARVIESLTTVGVPQGWLHWLAACQIAGGLGLIAGLFVPSLGIAAAIGVILFFVGAIGAHVRVGDIKGLVGPTPFLLLSIAALLVRLAA
jgi:hypothetical protein